MSPHDTAVVSGGAGESPDSTIDEERLLRVLTDDRCREILTSVDGGPRTAKELLDRLEIPCSTLYRKIELLVDAGLLEEQRRVRLDGNNETAYVRRIDELSLDIDIGSSLTIDLSSADEPV